MKNYLRAYIAYTQDNWVDHLSIAEFTTSNHVNALTGVITFFADHNFYPQTGIKPPRMYKEEQKAKLLVANKIIYRQEEMMAFLKDQLAWSQDKQTQFANRTCQPHPEYKISNKVYMDARYFAFERDKKLMDLKNARPWKIIQNIDNKAYELAIPQSLKEKGLTLIFDPWKLHLAPNNPFSGQILPPGPPIKISAKNDKAHKEWKVLEVIDCYQTKWYGIQYKAMYVGNWDKWNASPPWQPWTDFERSREKIHKFHCTHPQKPQLPSKLAAVDSSLNDIRATLASSV